VPHGALFYDKAPVDDFAALFHSYQHRDLASPFRSTIPLLSLVKDGWHVFRDVLARCQVAEDAALHFEYRQDVVRGHGKPSHTDLIVCSSEHSIAIEAKWTEPRYETVAEWLERGESKRHTEVQRGDSEYRPSNRDAVMSGWYELLQSRAPGLDPLGNFDSAIYQMVHRAASACGRSAQPKLGYVKFECASESHSHCTTYWDDLGQLYKLLGGPRDFRFHLIEIEVTPTSDF
jgi:hypothetical protein